MSPHGDLINFGYLVLGTGLIVVTYYFYYWWAVHKENERHHRAIETAIKRLGGCAYGRGR